MSSVLTKNNESTNTRQYIAMAKKNIRMKLNFNEIGCKNLKDMFVHCSILSSFKQYKNP